MSVLLVRHGEADAAGCCYGARHDVPLSAAGREQAAAAAARVGTPGVLLSSPARRALQTAACFGMAPAPDSRWIERDFGAWEGRPWTDCWAQVPEEVTRDPDRYAAFTPPEGEPLEAVQRRVADALDELAAGASGGVADAGATSVGGPVVVVTHAGPIRLALRHALGLTVRQCFALNPAPGTVTALRRVGESWVVDRVGA